jgi:hypothetical protein
MIGEGLLESTSGEIGLMFIPMMPPIEYGV